jgi:mRNA interferase HigB
MSDRADARVPKRNHLISRKKFRNFVRSHPRAVNDLPALLNWCKVVERACWASFADIRATFNTADQVGRCVVFDVGGNIYRVIARVNYQSNTVFVRHVLTHLEYDAGAWKSNP